MMKKIAISRLNELYALIAGDRQLFMPVYGENGKAEYKEWTPEAKTALDATNTEKSPKEMHFPQSEDLVGFKTDGKTIEVLDVRKPAKPFVLFGIRACDVKSFDILDTVFLQGYLDTYYEARRKAGIVVAHACSAPDTTCFCTTFGIDPAEPGADVSTWTAGDSLYWQANTEKGESLTNFVSSLLEDADEGAVEEEKAKIREISEKLPFAHLDLTGIDGDHQDEMFNSPAWEELSQSCLGCGTCTFVCPTCQCYDIRDFDTGNGIKRFRTWDSCMYTDFTMMAHGNLRNSQMQRFRQRFMHKLNYQPTMYGFYGCVGCGRCVAKCPQNLNIVKVIKKLGGGTK
jgi:ferredoxin